MPQKRSGKIVWPFLRDLRSNGSDGDKTKPLVAGIALS